jgi:hypothetical protein
MKNGFIAYDAAYIGVDLALLSLDTAALQASMPVAAGDMHMAAWGNCSNHLRAPCPYCLVRAQVDSIRIGSRIEQAPLVPGAREGRVSPSSWSYPSVEGAKCVTPHSISRNEDVIDGDEWPADSVGGSFARWGTRGDGRSRAHVQNQLFSAGIGGPTARCSGQCRDANEVYFTFAKSIGKDM